MHGGYVMWRRLWVAVVIATWVGVAPAQSPPARPAPQPSGEILIQKTAGQPERRLRLLKFNTGPDGERVADLQDLGTGARYTVPVAALAGMTRAPAGPTDAAQTTPPPALPSVRPAAPSSKFPTSLPLPEPSPGSHSPFTARQLTPTPQPRSRPQPAGPTPVAPGSLDTPLTALVVAPAGRPIEPPPLVIPTLVPTAMLDAEPPRRPPVAYVPPVPAAPAPVQPVAFHMPAAPAVAAWQMTRAEQMRAEVEPYTSELVNALRPSVRERAATALANGRHASNPEVKQLLARTAMTDPAPTVQAHCVRLLAALGYHAADYVEFLEASRGSDHTGLRQAAAIALAKLAPR